MFPCRAQARQGNFFMFTPKPHASASLTEGLKNAVYKLLLFRHVERQKIQGTYFKISALYFKIYALCFLQQAMCYFR